MQNIIRCTVPAVAVQLEVSKVLGASSPRVIATYLTLSLCPTQLGHQHSLWVSFVCILNLRVKTHFAPVSSYLSAHLLVWEPHLAAWLTDDCQFDKLSSGQAGSDWLPDGCRFPSFFRPRNEGRWKSGLTGLSLSLGDCLYLAKSWDSREQFYLIFHVDNLIGIFLTTGGREGVGLANRRKTD